MNRLPEELIVEIFKYLELTELDQLATVSERVHRISRDHSVNPFPFYGSGKYCKKGLIHFEKEDPWEKRYPRSFHDMKMKPVPAYGMTVLGYIQNYILTTIGTSVPVA